MHQMIELHPKADALDVLGLPAIPYPVALPAFQAAVANDAELPLADMLRGLQRLAADAGVDGPRLEPAMARLAELLAGDDGRDVVVVAGDGWRLDVGAAGPEGAVFALQRGDTVVATLAPRADGCLRIAAYRPLDASTIALLLRLAAVNAPLGAGADDSGGDALRAAFEAAVSAATDAGADARAGTAHHRLLPASVQPAGDDGILPRRPACVAAEIRAFAERPGA